MAETIIETSATGKELSTIMHQLGAVLENVDRTPGLISIITLSLLIMHPDITPEELQAGVLETSKFMCLLHTPDLTTDGDIAQAN